MDLGGVDDLGVASSDGGALFSSCPTLVGKHGGPAGSSFQKHGRSCEPEDYDWRSLKQARTEGMVAAPTKAAPFLPLTNSHFLFSGGEQMLSFSSAPKQDDALMLASDATLPYYLQPSASHSYLRNAGLYSGSSDSNMNGVLARARGPFTPSQWLELEHQALIFKYMVANVPIPAGLFISIRRSLNAGLTPFSAGTFDSRTLGWGSSFHLGYSGNADPEPGRCRRTDGKKWRCSRDAVVDQKYCERHINRGRHRSRKHVEAHSGHAVKAISVSVPSETGTISSKLRMTQLQAKSLQANATDPSAQQFSRFSTNKENGNDTVGSESLLMNMSQKLINAQFCNSKPYNPFESVTPQTDFGLVHTDSLLNASSSTSSNANFSGSSKLNYQQPQTNPLRHSIDDWPKSHCDHSTVTWNGEGKQSDRTQLSSLISAASSDFFPTSSSLNNELSFSSLKLSRECDPLPTSFQLGLLREGHQRQANWISMSWENSATGPLGEVLTNANNMCGDLSKNSSSPSLNLLTDGCDSSRQLESYPTDVAQETSFDLPSGSNRNSPMEENQKSYGIADSITCDGILGSSFVGPPAIPSL